MKAVRPARRWRRFVSLVVWYLIPVILVLSAAGYTYVALVVHVNPPVVAVEGSSMRPTLRSGELVVLAPVHVNTLKKGDVIAVRVSSSARVTYDLPATVMQRVVRVEHSPTGPIVLSESGHPMGVEFTTPANDVVGRRWLVVPVLGYAFHFATSIEGVIFFVALVVIWLLYFFFGVIDERRRRRSTGDAPVSTTSVSVQEAPTTPPESPVGSGEHIEGLPPESDHARVDLERAAISSDVIRAEPVGAPEASDERERPVQEPKKSKKEAGFPDDAKAQKSPKDPKKKRKKEKKRKKKG